MHILYLVHDLSDPAVRRRVAMLKAGGAEVTLAGFRRAVLPPGLEAVSPIELGRTADGRFAQRLVAVARAAATLGSRLKGIRRPDVIIGRNLEMLALARRAKALFSADIPLVYECLDIHRLLLGENGVSRAMRGAERALGRQVSLLLTSSPAFVREYFRGVGQIDAPVVLLLNKVLELSENPTPPQVVTADANSFGPDGRPWTIGWFGALRCRRSLELLAAVTRRMQGRFEVVLRGRPAYSEFADFDGFVGAEPFMRFKGAYRNPEDLAAIYGAVDFSWAIDFFEEGLNSSWLLPNRLYEGCLHGAVPIAMRGTETGRFLAERHMGLLLDEASPEALAALLEGITPER
jgi:succinoglycan biosynthesis protein ExoL